MVATDAIVTSVTRRNISARAARQLALRMLTAALGVGVAAGLSRALGPSAFGNFQLALTLAATGTAIADMGLTQVAIREMARHPERRAEVAGGLVLGRTLLGLVAMGLSVGASLLLADDSGTRIAAVIVLSTLALTGVTSVIAIAQARLRADLATAVTVLQSVLWLLLVVALGLAEASLWTFAVAFLATNVVQAALGWRIARHLTEIDWSRAGTVALQLFRTGLPFGLAGLCVTAYYRINGVILFETRGPIESGQFAAAYRLIDTLQMIPATLAAIIVPLIAAREREHADTAAGQVVFRLAIRLLLVATIPVIAVGIALAEPIVDLVYGDPFASSAHVLALLLPAFAFIAGGYVVTSVLIARADFRGYAAIVAAWALVNVVANLILLPRYGAPAAAWTTTATEAGVISCLALRLRLRHGYATPVGPLLIAAALGVASWAATAAILAATGPIVAGVAGLLVFAVGALVTGLFGRRDLTLLLSTRHEVHA